jgi:hypothetical protein
MSPAQPSTASAKKLGDFIWNIADVSLRSVYKPHQYGSVFLPMAILRRSIWSDRSCWASTVWFDVETTAQLTGLKPDTIYHYVSRRPEK